MQLTMKTLRTILTFSVAVGVMLVASEPAFAQCAMCKEAIANSADAAAASKGLNLAALVLLIPPVMMFAGLFGVFYRYRNVQGRAE
jgi:heme/copper-type cytochrome/quinol oxidase subunit 3